MARGASLTRRFALWRSVRPIEKGYDKDEVNLFYWRHESDTTIRLRESVLSFNHEGMATNTANSEWGQNHFFIYDLHMICTISSDWDRMTPPIDKNQSYIL